MDALKKNPLFAALLLASVAAVGFEGWQIYATRQRALRAAVQLEAKRQERDWLAHRSPALSEENERAIAADVAALEQKVSDLRTLLAGRGQWLPAAPAISRDSYFALGKFTQHLKALAVEQQIALPGDERFGFATYANEGPDADLVAPVHRQRVVIQHLVETLFEARPRSLVGVQRERPLTVAQRTAMRTPPAPGAAPVAAPTRASGQSADFFEPDARLRLHAPGLVEGELYRFEFTGQTQALRAFLNGLVASPLPVVVRAVEVEPAGTDVGATADAETAAAPSTAASAAQLPVPLVTRNFSKFAVVVECVDVLPVASGSAS